MKTIRAIGIVLTCLASLLTLAVSIQGASRASFRMGPVPSWVLPVDAKSSSASDGDHSTGVVYLIDDAEQRVTDNSLERYYHQTYKVTSAAGLEKVSQLKPEFEPSYEELIFHRISIKRGSTIINALKPGDIKLIEQEPDLDQREYNGRVSAVVILSDLRIGDTVDYEYSVNGANPVMRGRFATRMFLGNEHPIQYLRRRMVVSPGRSMYVKSFNTTIEPVVRERNGAREYLWERRNVPTVEFEDSLPDWFDPIPAVQVTDFSSWQDVIAWELPLFKSDSGLSAELAKQIQDWGRASARPEDRLLAALRFVQNDVRYMAIEIGPYSSRPNSPSTVFKRRYGDCKDKSTLLVAILNRLGIEARPALVNTQAEAAVGAFEPSPFVFDHCIVKAECGGASYWLDPTMSYQGGGLANASIQSEQLALVLKDGNNNLEPIPPPKADSSFVSVSEVYTVSSYSAPVDFKVVTTYRGAAADSDRYSLTQESLADVSKDFLNYYADIDPDISEQGEPIISDDQASDKLVITEHYSIPRFWGGGGRRLFGDRINEELRRPSITQRKMPLAVNFPVYVEQSIEMGLPDTPILTSDSGTISDSAVRFAYDVGVSGHAVKLKFEYRTLKDSVETADVAKHLATIERIRNVLNQQVTHGAGSSGELSTVAAVFLTGILAMPILIIAVVVMAVRRSAKRRLREFTGGLRPRDGESPQRPIPIRASGDVLDNLRSLRCRCGSGYGSAPDVPVQRLIFDGRRLIVATVTCASCSTPRDAYFAPSDLA